MKSRINADQLGADPEVFSNAQTGERAPGSEYWRTHSAVTTDPFAEPVYGEPLPRTQESETADTYDEEPEAYAEVAEAAEPDVTHMDWEILRPQEFTIEGGTGEGATNTDARRTLPGRFAWLNDTIRQWGGDARLAIGSFDGEEKYRIAVLPTFIGGVAVEHAIAETETAANGAFVLHGEATLDIDDRPEFSWMDVFNGTKPEAEGFGARKFNHTPTINERIRDYLDAPYSD